MNSPLSDYLSYSLQHYTQWKAFSGTIGSAIAFKSEVPGVLLITPIAEQTPCKRIILSCGIHGNETAPIEICNALIRDIYEEKLSCQHELMFVFGNLPAMQIAKRFVDENLNRLFDPEASTLSGLLEEEANQDMLNLEEHRALVLKHAVDNFFSNASSEQQLIHYDLHTAIRPSKNEKFAVYPYLHGRPYCKEQLQFLSDCGVNTILLSQTPATTFSYYSSRKFGAHAFTVELGKVKPFGENDMASFTAVTHMLAQLIKKEAVRISKYEDCPLEIFTVNQVINKTKDDFSLHFSDDAANFTAFKKGEVLASESGAEYCAEYDGEAIVFPNAQVALGQRALLTVIPCEL
ncbi:succinylglutamate desuccinylase [Agaribacter flavus]|uniref:Succinylglutamate desuccinylase n=1 Tax=Agaribacter flavus TaxID=1902781 RepID=A0ABV7FMR2_9ALTE